jgi:hypothetical protein
MGNGHITGSTQPSFLLCLVIVLQAVATVQQETGQCTSAAAEWVVTKDTERQLVPGAVYDSADAVNSRMEGKGKELAKSPQAQAESERMHEFFVVWCRDVTIAWVCVALPLSVFFLTSIRLHSLGRPLKSRIHRG